MAELEAATNIIALDRPIVEAALALGSADFEDGLQDCAACAVPAIEGIATCYPKDFAASTLLVLTPPQALVRLSS